MNEEYFSIGEVSQIKGITIKAMRFYDRIGLIKPYYVDPSNQYRYYHAKQFIYFDIIKAARSMDISPNALIPFFKNKDSSGLMDYLALHKELTLQKIRDMENVVKGIDQVIKTIDIAKTTDEKKIYRRQLPDRHIIITPFDISMNQETVMNAYSQLDITINNRRLINTYESGILFSKDEDDNFKPEYLYTTIAEAEQAADYKLLPGGNYICIKYTKKNINKQIKKLYQYLIANNLLPLDLVQIELLDNLFAEETEYFEMQARI